MSKLSSLVAVLACAAWLPACAMAQDAKTSAPVAPQVKSADAAQMTPVQKVSYIFGLNIGRNFQQQMLEVDADMLARGVKDAAPGAKTLMTDEEMEQFMLDFQKDLMAKQEARFQELSEKNKKAGAEFLAKNAKEPGVVATKSGLQYKMITEGAGATPKPTDTVKVIFSGKLLDGTEFGSSRDGKPEEVPMEYMFPGWVEALQLMKVGGHMIMWIPGELAYQDAAPPSMEPYATLVMDVTLVDILPQPVPEEIPAEEPATAPAK